jgi:hypothetical protein
MAQALLGRSDIVSRIFLFRFRRWFPAALVMFFASPLASLQTAPPQAQSGKTLAPGATATVRYTTRLDVPRPSKSTLRLQEDLGSWNLNAKSQEITIPGQDFYIADLRNGDAITVIDGVETHRYVGELWTVKAGQSMVVRIPDGRRQTILLHIFSVRLVQ